MLLDEGKLAFIGDAEDAALRYYRVNFGRTSAGSGRGSELEPVASLNARVIDAAVCGEAGERVENVEQGFPIVAELVFEAARELASPIFAFHVVNADGVVVFAFTRELDESVTAGQRVRLLVRLENRLVAGRYYLDCWIRQDEAQTAMALQGIRVLSFVVYGTAPRHGVVTLGADVEAEVQEP
jgi:hypothetical protein